jgi:hypothetical protein
MGIPVLILGESGSGKSASLRNFKPEEIGIINVNGKPFPFRNQLKSVNTDSYTKIQSALKNSKVKTLVIDDSQYLMANEFMRMAKVTGYQKFTDIGLNFWNLINTVSSLPDDKIVYFLHHIETTDTGRQKIKTIGKMLDEKITLEGMFAIVLKTSVHDGHYYFSTQNNGLDTVKTPIGMFESDEIENDLKAVDTAIRKYYEIGEKT